jgi:phosphate transport system permease protein
MQNRRSRSSVFPLRRVERFQTPWSHRLAERLIAVAAWTSIACVLLIFLFVAKEALPILWEAGREPGTALLDLMVPRMWRGYVAPVFVWQPIGEPGKYNIVPLLVGTFKVTVLAMLVSVPLAVGSAVFVSQYASRRAKEWIKPAIELLAGVPSVVLGFFALMILASVVQRTFGFTYRLNAVVAALGLSLAIIPLVFTISEDALSTVPRSLSDASLALGARKWQTTLFVVLPAALPGIAAAVVLGFGRAIGETMIVLMASGNAAVVALFELGAGARTVTATIASELGEVARGEFHWRVLFALGFLLFVLTFVLNRFGDAVVRYLTRRLTAGSGS